MSKKLYRVKDLMAMLSIGRTLLYRAIREGRLVGLKVGRITVFTQEAVDAFIASLPPLKPKRT